MKRIIAVIVLFVIATFLNSQLNIVLMVDPLMGNSENQFGNLQFYGVNNAGEYNITLWITDWKENITFGDTEVTIYDLESKKASTYVSNETGHIDLKFIPAGSYAISVQKGTRTVGYQKINVVQNETFTIRTWSYDLNITLVDEKGDPLANHTISIYDQMDQVMFYVGTGNGTQTEFYIGHPCIVEDSDTIYLNGILTKDYTLDYTTGKITFNIPPENMTKITADYSYWTVMTKDVRRAATYTVVTDEHGPLITQAETDENGTVHFAGVWNGTYRLAIQGKEKWIEEYILGKPVLTLQEPASGEWVIDLQKPANITLKCVRTDLKLKFISKSNVPVRNATVYIRNMSGHLLFKDHTNETGFVEQKNVYPIDGMYVVSARYGNRTVGYALFDATKNEVFTVECWSCNLTISCVDQDGKPLPNRLVFLYDQLVFYSPTNITVETNQTGLLINSTKTDENGTAYFNDVWNGTYWIRVIGSQVIGEKLVNLQRTESVTLVCNETYMKLRFISSSGGPLSNVTVLVFDEAGNLIFREHPDKDGYVSRGGMTPGSYTVYVEFMGVQAWSGTVDIRRDRDKTIRFMVYRLTLNFVDQFGNKLSKADVTLKKITSRGRYGFTLELETDENGRISYLLPYGSYEVFCSAGIYSGSIIVNLDNDYVTTVICNVNDLLWISIFGVAFPLVILTLLMERRKLKKPLEIKKYRDMLSRLESMYKNGTVEYRIYRKLREEYEAKIMELGGREMR